MGRSCDQLTVYNQSGGVVWTRNPFGNGEVRTLAVADLETDGQLEIVVVAAGDPGVSSTCSSPTATCAGLAGAPHRRGGLRLWAVQRERRGGGHERRRLQGDLRPHRLPLHHGPRPERQPASANAIYNGISPAGPKVWSQVGVHVDNASTCAATPTVEWSTARLREQRPRRRRRQRRRCAGADRGGQRLQLRHRSLHRPLPRCRSSSSSTGRAGAAAASTGR